MKLKLTSLLPVALFIGVAGCQQVTAEDVNSPPAVADDMKETMSEREQEIVAQMEWVQTADAKTDANKALHADGKPEIIAFAGRGMSYPGLTSAQYEEIKDRVTYRTAMGSGDVLFGNTHKALRSQLSDYASEYNTVIYNALVK